MDCRGRFFLSWSDLHTGVCTLNNTKIILKKKEKKENQWYKDSHAPRTLFSSRLEYLPHSANVNLRVWSLFRHNTSILAFHSGFIFK